MEDILPALWSGTSQWILDHERICVLPYYGTGASVRRSVRQIGEASHRGQDSRPYAIDSEGKLIEACANKHSNICKQNMHIKLLGTLRVLLHVCMLGFTLTC